MSADFISYCVFGPNKLSTNHRKMKKATQVMNDLVAVALRAEHLQAADPNDKVAELELEELVQTKLKNHEDLYDLRWAVKYQDKPSRLIDELFEVWHHGSYDTSDRLDPRDPKRKVWYAGDMTWGDEPSGFGFVTMKHADMAGLLDIFEIE